MSGFVPLTGVGKYVFLSSGVEDHHLGTIGYRKSFEAHRGSLVTNDGSTSFYTYILYLCKMNLYRLHSESLRLTDRIPESHETTVSSGLDSGGLRNMSREGWGT